MTYFADLSPYDYQDRSDVPYGRALNVGWLEKGHPYRFGVVPAGFAERLAILCVWRELRHARGVHNCEWCAGAGHQSEGAEAGGLSTFLGTAEIDVSGENGTVYSAPNLIYHYVVAHAYRPPDEFIEAVLRCDAAKLTDDDRPPTPESSWPDWPYRLDARLTLWPPQAGGLRWAQPSGSYFRISVPGSEMFTAAGLEGGGDPVRVVTPGEVPLRAGSVDLEVVLHFRHERAYRAVEAAEYFKLLEGTPVGHGSVVRHPHVAGQEGSV